jgi:mono/diheme cytochrome c family protein
MRVKLILTSILAISIVFIVACGGGNTESTLANQEDKAVQDHPGKKIYNSYCIVCHGSDGSMGANGAHNLQESILNLEERIVVITNGRNTMTAFEKVISADKIRQVAEYVETFRPKTSE